MIKEIEDLYDRTMKGRGREEDKKQEGREDDVRKEEKTGKKDKTHAAGDQASHGV